MRAGTLALLVPLAVICFGVRYAVGRERLRDPDHLHALYQETNKDFFGGQLPDVVVKAEDLSEAKAERRDLHGDRRPVRSCPRPEMEHVRR